MTPSVLTHIPSVAAPSLEEAYALCRQIARREAKNFYYAFLALPSAKRNAICAVYAFMRHADDLADDEGLPRPERLARMQQWQDSWRQAAQEGISADPVFVALADARLRFDIPLTLLDQLVEGTTMDLISRDANQTDTYATFDDLHRYCYLVASVVGLVCIRIFGYTDPHAEQLAEELGIAFQLTNILRDVREDAERGRIYLPLEDLTTYGIPQSAFSGSLGKVMQSAHAGSMRKLLAFEAARAEHFYDSGDRLLPMIEPDSRPALQVLIRIYHLLLRRIVRTDYDVFSRRISVPGYRKTAILILGLLGVLRARLVGRA